LIPLSKRPCAIQEIFTYDPNATCK
jgi:hypothetical protein